MQAQANPGAARTAPTARAARGEGVERGIFKRGGRWIVSYTLDSTDHYKTIGFIARTSTRRG